MTTGIRDAGANGFNSTTHGDSETAMVTSTGSTEIAGDGTTGGFMVPRARNTTTALPATIETTMSSGNRNQVETNCRFGGTDLTSPGSWLELKG